MLEEEDQKLKQLVADLSLDKKMLWDVLANKPEPAAAEDDRGGPAKRPASRAPPINLAKGRGAPREVRVDNGPEFVGKMLDLWAHWDGMSLIFSHPSKPTDDKFIESFNGRPREESLSQCNFTGPEDSRDMLEAGGSITTRCSPTAPWDIRPPMSSPHAGLGSPGPLQTEGFSLSRSNLGERVKKKGNT